MQQTLISLSTICDSCLIYSPIACDAEINQALVNQFFRTITPQFLVKNPQLIQAIQQAAIDAFALSIEQIQQINLEEWNKLKASFEQLTPKDLFLFAKPLYQFTDAIGQFHLSTSIKEKAENFCQFSPITKTKLIANLASCKLVKNPIKTLPHASKNSIMQLFHLVKKNQFYAFKFLLEQVQELFTQTEFKRWINQEKGRGYTLYHYAIKQDSSSNFTNLLIEKGIDFHFVPKHVNSIFDLLPKYLLNIEEQLTRLFKNGHFVSQQEHDQEKTGNYNSYFEVYLKFPDLFHEVCYKGYLVDHQLTLSDKKDHEEFFSSLKCLTYVLGCGSTLNKQAFHLISPPIENLIVDLSTFENVYGCLHKQSIHQAGIFLADCFYQLAGTLQRTDLKPETVQILRQLVTATSHKLGPLISAYSLRDLAFLKAYEEKLTNGFIPPIHFWIQEMCTLSELYLWKQRITQFHLNGLQS